MQGVAIRTFGDGQIADTLAAVMYERQLKEQQREIDRLRGELDAIERRMQMKKDLHRRAEESRKSGDVKQYLASFYRRPPRGKKSLGKRILEYFIIPEDDPNSPRYIP